MQKAEPKKRSFIPVPHQLLAAPLSPATKLIYMALLDQFIEGGQGACPSTTELATQTGLHKKWVPSCLRELHKQGWISVIKRRGRSSRYVIRQHTTLSNHPTKAVTRPTKPATHPIKTAATTPQKLSPPTRFLCHPTHKN